MAKARVPHVALVLLPALLLAAVGVRAVTAEMRASEDAVREQARSIASRLARTIDALVAEYQGALPKPGTSLTREQAKEVTAHLQPRRALTTDGVSLALDHDLPPDPGPVPESEAALVEDALQRANELAEQPNGYVAAAALACATSTVVRHPVARARLLYAAAEQELTHSKDDESCKLFCSAVEAGAWIRDTDGTPFDVRAARLALRVTRESGRIRGFDFARLHARLAEDVWGPRYVDDTSRMFRYSGGVPGSLDGKDVPRGTEPVLLNDTETAWGADLSDSDIEESRAWTQARLLAARLSDSASRAPPTAVLELDRWNRELSISVWTSVQIDGQATLLGGDIPPEVLSHRLKGEIAALRSEARAASVSLRMQQQSRTYKVREEYGRAHDVVVETVPLAEPLSECSAEAVVPRKSSVPATAWLLGAAVLVTTAALVGGMIALRRSADRSARLAEDRQTFLDHVAHELRTPAAAVQALTEELASGHVTKEREAAYREHLLRESRRLSALVEDTLDLTRLDAGRLAFKMEPADLRDVVRRAVEESDGAGRVIATLPDAPVVRPVDEATLRRAVKNLVENAIRHGGDAAPVRVTLEASDGAASISVADEGRGIAKEHLPRLFERFYRVPSATHETKGVGLGLALCREVARAHGGDVGVTSVVGKGSTFTIRIPLA